jgi:hypothetical protein
MLMGENPLGTDMISLMIPNSTSRAKLAKEYICQLSENRIYTEILARLFHCTAAD